MMITLLLASYEVRFSFSRSWNKYVSQFEAVSFLCVIDQTQLCLMDQLENKYMTTYHKTKNDKQTKFCGATLSLEH